MPANKYCKTFRNKFPEIQFITETYTSHHIPFAVAAEWRGETADLLMVNM
jgi:hypothetical protein